MLIDQIKSDLKQALKAKEELRVSVLRLLLAEIGNQRIEKKAELTDEEIGGVIRKEVKKRKEAIAAYEQGKRDDLVKKEGAELKVLSTYFPQQMSPEELEKVVSQVITEVGASGAKDFGKVMGVVMGKVKGKAEGAIVAEIVKELLG